MIHQGCPVNVDGVRVARRVDGDTASAKCCPLSTVHFFLSAFWAALVLLPSTTLGVVALMTPTATVCLMSRTANLDRVGLKETFKE